MQPKRSDTSPEIAFPELEAKVAAAAVARPLSSDAPRICFQIALGVFEQDRAVQEAKYSFA